MERTIGSTRSRTDLRRRRAERTAPKPSWNSRPFLRPHVGAFVAATALALLGIAFSLAAPWPVKVAVDNAIGGRPLSGSLAPLNRLSPVALGGVSAAAGVALVLGAGLMGYLSTAVLGSAIERVGAEIRSGAFDHLQHQSLRFHDRHHTGDLVSRITTDVGGIQEALLAWFETVVPDGLLLAGMLAVMFAIDPLMALAAVGVLPVLAVVILVSRNRIKRAERQADDRFGALSALASEMLRHVRVVQAFSRHREAGERFSRESTSLAASETAALTTEARLSPAIDVVLAVGAGMVLWLGVVRVTSGHMTLGLLLVVLAYLAEAYEPVDSLTRLVSTFAAGAASRDRLREIFDADERVSDDARAVPAPEASSVAFHAVRFGYHEGRDVLRDVSFGVEEGETLCVVGPTGAGKSTILSLVLRLYDPDAGSIELGGTDLRRIRLGSLRNRLALVPQDAWLVDGTIAENIRFGRPDATEEDVRTAGRIALVDEFADRLPEGYRTAVGESGTRLSGGQRRRIALARALVRNAQILLLDEPTSGLDMASETQVLRALKRSVAGRTVLIVSHRLRVAELADRILVLDAGRVVEEGSADELIARGGYFRELWRAQFDSGLYDPSAPARVRELEAEPIGSVIRQQATGRR